MMMAIPGNDDVAPGLQSITPLLWRLLRFSELEAAVEVVVEVDGRLLVALVIKRLSAGGCSRKHAAFLRARHTLLETVGVVV